MRTLLQGWVQHTSLPPISGHEMQQGRHTRVTKECKEETRLGVAGWACGGMCCWFALWSEKHDSRVLMAAWCRFRSRSHDPLINALAGRGRLGDQSSVGPGGGTVFVPLKMS